MTVISIRMPVKCPAALPRAGQGNKKSRLKGSEGQSGAAMTGWTLSALRRRRGMKRNGTQLLASRVELSSNDDGDTPASSAAGCSSDADESLEYPSEKLGIWLEDFHDAL